MSREAEGIRFLRTGSQEVVSHLLKVLWEGSKYSSLLNRLSLDTTDIFNPLLPEAAT